MKHWSLELPAKLTMQFHKRREAALRLRSQAGEPQKGKSHLNQKKIAKIGAHKKKHKDQAERRARKERRNAYVSHGCVFAHIGYDRLR